MLKPVDPPPPPERPIGELVHELIENGKAYARAEFDLYKAIAAAKGKALAIPAALFAVAFICTLAAGFVGMLIFAGIAGLLGWAGYQKLRRDL